MFGVFLPPNYPKANHSRGAQKNCGLSRVALGLGLFFGGLFFSPQSLEAVARKKVLVMDFKNIEGDAAYDYLEPSITEAVTKELQERYVFELIPPTEWKALAKQNFFFADSFHTPTIGMQLGLLARQDVVIGGGFTIKDNTFITKVHIIGVAQKKILKQFEVTGYTDSRIWTSVKNLAETIAKTAADVLPNEEEWSTLSLAGKNQISLTTSLVPWQTPAAIAEPLPSGSNFSLGPSDFPLVFGAGLEYRYFGLIFPDTLIWGQAAWHSANTDLEASGHSPEISQVKASLTGYGGSLGAGYRFFNAGSFYLSAGLTGGYQLYQILIDFTTLNNLPGKPGSSEDLTKREDTISGPTAGARFTVGYQLFTFLTVEAQVWYRHMWTGDTSYGGLYNRLALGYKF